MLCLLPLSVIPHLGH